MEASLPSSKASGYGAVPPELDLLAVARGSVTAPAGCGKTQLIADTLSSRASPKPTLVLTHTNAGVAALRARLQRAGVPGAAYRISTIDGFAMRLIGKFPMRSGHNPRILEVANPGSDYPAVREAAWRLLDAGHVHDALRATYGRLLVDEYQDCNLTQHAMVVCAARVLPTCVLGDPMQAIFGFKGNRLVDWQADVESEFPSVGTLQTPWRWRLAGTEELGNWLLGARERLQAGCTIDLTDAPAEVEWVQLTPDAAHEQRLRAARVRAASAEGIVLVIGDAMDAKGRHQLTSQTPGATAVEAVDLGDLVRFAQQFDPRSPDSLRSLLSFAATLMTGVDATGLTARVETIRQGRARTPPNPTENAAVAFANAPSASGARLLLQRLANNAGARVYRPEILRCLVTALGMAAHENCTLHAAVLKVREKNRHLGRSLARRAVGSTLLLKGLEADVAVVLHPERMTAQHLYVALTRGARRVVVCSASPVLQPAR